MVSEQNPQNVALIKSAQILSDRQETHPVAEKYEFRTEGKYPVAPSLHSVCWKVFENQTSVELLCSFALSMIPSLEIKTEDNIFASTDKYLLSMALRHLLETTETTGDLGRTSSLSSTLNRLKNLPEEIISLIWEFMPLTVVRCLISVQASARLMKQLSPVRQWSGVLLLHGLLNVFLRRLNGETYLCGLRNTYQQYGHKSDDCQQVWIGMPVVAVSPVIGLLGLVGIRCLMKDGRECYLGSPILNTEHARCMIITSPDITQPFFLSLEGDVRTSNVPFQGRVSKTDQFRRVSRSASSDGLTPKLRASETTSLGNLAAH